MIFKSHLCLLFGAYLVISALSVLGQRHKQCADYNEYCQTHSDCCSNSCLTYLYRCTRNYGGVYPYTFFGERYPVTGTLEDVIALTFNNIGNVEELQTRRQQNAMAAQRRSYGFDGNNHIFKRAIDSGSTTAAPSTSEHPQKVLSNTELTSEDDTLAVETRVSDCKAIGIKCYTNDECCSKRCHGFLHQCVT